MSLVCGVGINDLKGWARIDGSVERRMYDTWKDMLKRCYNKKYLEANPTYKGCTVCERWLRFSNFIEDIRLIPNFDLYYQGINRVLDKDIRVPGNKVYSLQTCMFVSKSESSRDVQRKHPGKVHSYDSRLKKSKKLSKSVKAVNILTGEEFIFSSRKEAGKVLGISAPHISSVITGKLKQTGGYYFFNLE